MDFRSGAIWPTKVSKTLANTYVKTCQGIIHLFLLCQYTE